MNQVGGTILRVADKNPGATVGDEPMYMVEEDEFCGGSASNPVVPFVVGGKCQTSGEMSGWAKIVRKKNVTYVSAGLERDQSPCWQATQSKVTRMLLI
jgi:hypothetical protein